MHNQSSISCYYAGQIKSNLFVISKRDNKPVLMNKASNILIKSLILAQDERWRRA